MTLKGSVLDRDATLIDGLCCLLLPGSLLNLLCMCRRTGHHRNGILPSLGHTRRWFGARKATDMLHPEAAPF